VFFSNLELWNSSLSGWPSNIFSCGLKLILGPQDLEVHGKTFYLDDSREALINKVEDDLEGHVCMSRVSADFVVCDNIMSSSRNLLAMALKGGGVMSSKYLMSDGDGPVLVFKSLLTTPKWLCLSQRFREEAPGLAKIIIAVVRAQQPPRLWKIHSFASLQVGC